jgi:thioesterase domain-containing protein
VPDGLSQRIFTPLHQQLAWIWQEVLQCERPSLDDNFFAAGGTSLAAVRLVSRINRHFHSGLSAASVFDKSSFEQIAEMIKEGRSHAALVARLWPKLAGPCLAYVAGAWGQDFAAPRFLRPFGMRAVMLRAPGLEPGEQSLDRFDEIAESSVARMLAADPGPFVVVGYSSGAVIALEVARRAVEMGANVRAAVLLDPGESTPASDGTRGEDDVGLLRDAILEVVEQVTRDRPQSATDHARHHDLAVSAADLAVRPIREIVEDVLQAVNRSAGPELVEHYTRRLTVYMGQARAVRGRARGPVVTRTIVVTTKPAEDSSWNSTVDDVTVLTTDFDHGDLLSSTELAERLAREVHAITDPTRCVPEVPR